MPITPARAKQIVQLIANHDDERANAGLIELIHAVADPHGDPERYAVAQTAMRQAFTHTTAFSNAFEEYLSGEAVDLESSGPAS